ncbi:hypothetical protein [Actinokineospora sp.]|uniref:hypothetical protein n=1 Tax=Actinokineospora sp. TaxID=1872133 RepID=UPI0040379A05
MSVEDLAAELRTVRSALELPQVHYAMDAIAQARDTLATVAQGSQAPDLHPSAAQLEHGRLQAEQAYDLVAQVRVIVQGYLARIGAQGSPTVATASTAPPRAGSPGWFVPRPQVGGERVQRILRELPPQVPKPNPSGKKTHGRLLDGDTATAMVSGHDEDSAEVSRLLKKRVYPRTVNLPW